ncbi:TRAP transporter large permease [Petroclostridium sp. X23]|uniref:TRAP transporter large permease n=1 Tax=Petroclostridium sp. X23 TaxID=3045146 RepID=UPI0024AD61EF|nr:TRAP transporter large permease [Petroclostridium sp. X23]WHH57682.1 TRAP transporter large permease [Petroclostridium sp. X23]
MVVLIFLLSLFGFILLNIPIAFSLLLTAVVLMVYMGDISPFVVMQSMIRGFDSFTLLAIPFFILAGEIMNVGGLSRRIVGFARSFIGQITGSLGYTSILSSMVFAGVSGSADADTSAIGSILLPIMKEEKYDVRTSTALIATSGCIGPVIPPSIPMILYGVTAGVSIVKLFLGGIVPGVLIGAGLMVVWGIHARKQGYKSTDKFSWIAIWVNAKKAFFALLLPVIILGGIVSGIVTPTESAVIAVVYAFFVSKFIYKELNLNALPSILVATARSTSIIMLVCGAAMSVAYYITTAHVPSQLSKLLLSVSDNIYVTMFLINILLLLIGCVMDLAPAIFLMTPILLPIIQSYSLDPVYFGVIMCVNLCIGLVTPPVGTVLYVVCGLSKISIFELTKPLLPFILVMIAVLLMITYVPGLIMFIPNAFA